MGFRGYILLVFGLVFCGVLLGKAAQNRAAERVFAAQNPPATGGAGGGQNVAGGNKTPVDIKADLAYRTPNLVENAILMVGNVVFHHNGAVISCDSAVRYSDKHIDCFQNVIINKDSTFVYGDRAEYNGDENVARVYSPVIKVIDGSATLYTYNFSFNTLDNIGTWFGGGVVYQDNNTMESERGYFYSDLHELVAVRGVQMKNESHQLVSDSVRYNTESKVATFYTRTHIWTSKGEMISALRGRYNTRDSVYFFTDSAYLLTPTRETWADTIDFNGRTEDALLLGNVQLDDNENSSSAFGDWAQYWGTARFDTLRGGRVERRQKGEVMLTRRPSVSNYNADQGNADTMYLRADTIFMFVSYLHTRRDSLAALAGTADSLARMGADSLPSVVDSLSRAMVDSLSVADTLAAADSLPVVAEKTKAQLKAERKALKARRRAAKMAAREARRVVKDSIRVEKLRVKAVKRAAQEARRALRRRLIADPLLDTLFLRDSLSRLDSLRREDSLMAHRVDSLEGLPHERTGPQKDSTLRTFRGWRNVKIWRPDMQAVADSMVGFSLDSTVHLYIRPVMWHSENQIVSDSITIFSSGGAMEHAEFYGSPIMSSQLPTGEFSQVKGREMSSWFRDNALYRHDAVGNAEALYYMQEEEEGPDGETIYTDPMAFLVMSSSEISFLVEDNFISYIIPRDNPDWTVYPMDQIPSSQPTRLQGFAWYGDRKPALADVFSRTWRLSERARYEALARPDFPVAARIYRRRQYLIDNRMWVDRSEPLPVHAIEFRSERRQ